MNWVGFAAAGTLVAGGILLLAGKRRAGMVAAASGTALALLDQQDTLPGYIEEVQRMLGQVQGTVDELATQREKLRRVLTR